MDKKKRGAIKMEKDDTFTRFVKAIAKPRNGDMISADDLSKLLEKQYVFSNNKNVANNMINRLNTRNDMSFETFKIWCDVLGYDITLSINNRRNGGETTLTTTIYSTPNRVELAKLTKEYLEDSIEITHHKQMACKNALASSVLGRLGSFGKIRKYEIRNALLEIYSIAGYNDSMLITNTMAWLLNEINQPEPYMNDMQYDIWEKIIYVLNGGDLLEMHMGTIKNRYRTLIDDIDDIVCDSDTELGDDNE